MFSNFFRASAARVSVARAGSVLSNTQTVGAGNNSRTTGFKAHHLLPAAKLLPTAKLNRFFHVSAGLQSNSPSPPVITYNSDIGDVKGQLRMSPEQARRLVAQLKEPGLRGLNPHDSIKVIKPLRADIIAPLIEVLEEYLGFEFDECSRNAITRIFSKNPQTKIQLNKLDEAERSALTNLFETYQQEKNEVSAGIIGLFLDRLAGSEEGKEIKLCKYRHFPREAEIESKNEIEKILVTLLKFLGKRVPWPNERKILVSLIYATRSDAVRLSVKCLDAGGLEISVENPENKVTLSNVKESLGRFTQYIESQISGAEKGNSQKS